MKKEIKEFLLESNAIEGVHGEEALEDALRAWNYISDKSFLTPEVILGTHNFLLKNLDPRIAGFWRNCDVWIGGKRKIFISTQLIEEDIKNLIFISEKLLAWAMDKNDSVKEEVCKILHIAFEKCHPFSDGNGRVFRLIMNWQRIKLNIPILLIKADWPQNDGDQKKYYSWFKDGGSGLTEYIKENNIKL